MYMVSSVQLPNVTINSIVIIGFCPCLLQFYQLFASMDILLSIKKNQNHCHQTRFLGSKCIQNAFAAGAPLRPEPHWGAQSAPPDPALAGFGGRFAAENGGKREGK